MVAFKLLALVALSGVISASVPFHPFSDEFIDHINSIQTTWRAGRNFPKHTSLAHIKRLLGSLDGEGYKTPVEVRNFTIDDGFLPENFDARQNWPECESIRMIRDQSSCASSWAVAAAAAMSDRICIYSQGTYRTILSDEELLSCCTDLEHGCDGGYHPDAWYYWKEHGIVSGGPYNSTSGCRAYSLPPCSHHNSNSNLPACESLGYETPRCIKQCDEGSALSFEDSKTFGTVYSVSSEEAVIRLEIMNNGPVEVDFTVYSDFPSYKSGVYQATPSLPKSIGKHAVRIIGWGVENEVPYWLVTNSWNESWGDKGLFKIRRGTNECGIESNVIAGEPRI